MGTFAIGAFAIGRLMVGNLTAGRKLRSVGTAITVQHQLMRHADIKTTLNVYGDVVTDEMRQAGSKIAGLAVKSDYEVITASVSH